jgi:hypothetical protein
MPTSGPNVDSVTRYALENIHFKNKKNWSFGKQLSALFAKHEAQYFEQWLPILNLQM